MPLFAGACVASAAFPTWFLINADVGHMPLAVSFAAGFLGGMLASPPGPNARWRALPDCAACSITSHTLRQAVQKLWRPLGISYHLGQ